MIWALFWVLLAIGQETPEPEEKKLTPEEQKIMKVQKELWFAHILRTRNTGSKIEGLEIPHKQIPVWMIPKGQSIRPLVRLKASLKDPSWRLFVGPNIPANPGGKEGEYLVYAFLNSRVSEVYFEARSPRGEVQKEIVYIFAPEAQEFKITSPLDAITVDVGVSQLVYIQSSFGVFTSESALLGLKYMTPENRSGWGVLANARMTVLTLSSSPIDANPQMVEGSFNMTKSHKIFGNPLIRSRLLFGVNTLSVLSHGSDFGFDFLPAPNLGVRSEFFYNARSSYAAEVHFIPYLGIFEGEFGYNLMVSWNTTFRDTDRFSFSATYSNYAFQSGVEDITVGLLGLNLGFGF